MNAEKFFIEQCKIDNCADLCNVFVNADVEQDVIDQAYTELFFLMDNYASFKNGMAGISTT